LSIYHSLDREKVLLFLNISVFWGFRWRYEGENWGSWLEVSISTLKRPLITV